MKQNAVRQILSGETLSGGFDKLAVKGFFPNRILFGRIQTGDGKFENDIAFFPEIADRRQNSAVFFKGGNLEQIAFLDVRQEFRFDVFRRCGEGRLRYGRDTG